MLDEFYLASTKARDHDSSVDTCIGECLTIGSGKSFITFAGAGSGKTYSLKKALDVLKERYFENFTRLGKKIAVVTFTNNAADEIKDRIEQSPIFTVSTIHSFCWSTIEGFNEDIRKWYLEKIPNDIVKLEEEEKRGRAGTAASDNRKRTIVRLQKKKEWLAESRAFIYDPNGVNSDPSALSHQDVLDIFSAFLITKPMMAELIVDQYPFIFIDESQDTNKDVVRAFFELRATKSEKVVIGLFGDTMQRIFGGGEPSLGKTKLTGLISFDKEMNHRSTRRIVGLGNQIRSEVDQKKQYALHGAAEGHVRYFLLPKDTSNKNNIESKIRKSMAKITGDTDWTDTQSKETAILLLEHKMAGRRLGFVDLWDKLSKSKKIKDQISDGKNTELNFFSSIVFPMAEASLSENRADLMSILRESKSPLLEANVFDVNKEDPLVLARTAEHAFRDVISNKEVTFRKVLQMLSEYNLLKLPEKLQPFVAAKESVTISAPKKTIATQEIELHEESEISAWTEALETNFFQIRNYKNYVDDNSIFRTHQGVKGNEFERVMVIMDDNEAHGNSFSYEQYFGVKELSKDSKKKQDAGEVICSS
ncbi:UvrD-helicase domain-containing protein [Vibrio minamisatsumaniensis]|uniref:UvrD-helicase domain-containing protein n=1 Tax=Vibrio minamisatsumaniensis TaxID=2910243 RepID=UPI003D1B0034